MNSDTFPIPDRLNSVLVFLVSTAAVTLLWFASQMTSWLAILIVGIVFSYAMLTNYALLHDATHETLRSTKRANYWCGLITGIWFPVPFSMIHYTHRSHHRFNRTDSEMFDLYYPTDNRLLKYIQWYSILCGLFWPLVPLGAVLIALTPSYLRSKLLSTADPARGLAYLATIPRDVVARTRAEMGLIAVIVVALFWLLDLHLAPVLVCYACFSFNWSTRQYITHAFSARDVIDGAFNLRHNRFMDYVLLHGQWDLNHHRYPDVSWYYLPQLAGASDSRRSYLRQYFRQWGGPIPATTPAPEPTGDHSE